AKYPDVTVPDHKSKILAVIEKAQAERKVAEAKAAADAEAERAAAAKKAAEEAEARATEVAKAEPQAETKTAEAQKAPVADGDSVFAGMFGKTLYNAEKEMVSVDSLAGKKVGIYFSAHWCPPCRGFTPKLVDFYNQLQKDGEKFEIVFVSSDRSKDAMYGYMDSAKMDWLTMEYKSAKGRALSRKYGVRGIPTLVIVDAEGKTISRNARTDVMRLGVRAYKEW
ncbi:MAG: thioredoxin family protein, partial [Verrucomicrobiota bacterium]